jgi:hypothetical protein
LTDYLESEGLSVWVDDRIDQGDRWWRSIVENIRKCAAMVVVMTPESENTDWVEKEYLYAKEINKPLIPLLLRDECFPFFVNQQYHDVNDRLMPHKAFVETLRRFVRLSKEERKRKEEEQIGGRTQAEGSRGKT